MTDLFIKTGATHQQHQCLAMGLEPDLALPLGRAAPYLALDQLDQRRQEWRNFSSIQQALTGKKARWHTKDFLG